MLPSADPHYGGQKWLALTAAVTLAMCLPYTQAIFSLGDEGVLWHAAVRMLRGEFPYTGFFEFLPPGSLVIVTAWFSLTGLSVGSARSFAILVTIGIACMTWLACRRAAASGGTVSGGTASGGTASGGTASAGLATIMTLAWVAATQGTGTQINHHWLTTLCVMVLVWAALPSPRMASPPMASPPMASPATSRPNPVFAGLAGGMASMIVPTCGALTMLAALTAFPPVRRRVKPLIAYIAAGAVVPVMLILWLLWHGAFLAAFEDVVIFPATHYASIQHVSYGAWTSPQSLPAVLVFPMAALLTVLVVARDGAARFADPRFRPAVAFAIAGFIGCFPRPDAFHIAFQVPLALPLLTCAMTSLSQGWKPVWRFASIFILCNGLATSGAAFTWLSIQTAGAAATATPRGTAALIGQDGFPAIMTRLAALPAAEPGFFYPFIPVFAVLTGREHVAKHDVFTPGYTTPEQYAEDCGAVMRRAAWIVIDRENTRPEVLRHMYPAMKDPTPPETVAFERALDAGFALTAQEGRFELRRRLDTATEALCHDIAPSAPRNDIAPSTPRNSAR